MTPLIEVFYGVIFVDCKHFLGIKEKNFFKPIAKKKKEDVTAKKKIDMQEGEMLLFYNCKQIRKNEIFSPVRRKVATD